MPPDFYRHFNRQHKKEIQQLKNQQECIDGNTPPPGFEVSPDGTARPATRLVSVINATIGTASGSIVQLPPAPTGEVLPVPEFVNTTAATAGQSFGRRGSRTPPNQQFRGNDDSSTIASISIVNGKPHQGPIFNVNGNRLN